MCDIKQTTERNTEKVACAEHSHTSQGNWFTARYMGMSVRWAIFRSIEQSYVVMEREEGVAYIEVMTFFMHNE